MNNIPTKFEDLTKTIARHLNSIKINKYKKLLKQIACESNDNSKRVKVSTVLMKRLNNYEFSLA